jgi:hypothetical protein
MTSDVEAAKWFETVFVGEWIEIPLDLTAPDWIVEESRQWADDFLDSDQNPYRQLQGRRQQIYLGRANAPDKMVTTFRDVRVIETLQHFIVTRLAAGGNGIKTVGAALEVAQQALQPLLSAAARAEVTNVVAAAPVTRRTEALEDAQPVVLASPARPLGTVRSWQDKVNLIWYQSKPYVDFYKTYTEFATFIYQTGLDWFPQEWRERLGAQR